MGVVRPPVELTLARGVAQVPRVDGWRYEPKLDGWRALVFSLDGVVQSRRDNDLARRFPEIVHAARRLGDVVLDGELVALRNGRLDFGALAAPPRSRAGAEVTVYYTVFDLLADETRDLRGEPWHVRRGLLEHRLADVAAPLQLIPVAEDPDTASAWLTPELADVGVEGVVAKKVDAPYRGGRTGDWQKVRSTVVVDAVVVGVTGPVIRPEAVVLARPDHDGVLHPVGLSLPLSPALRDAAARHVMATGEPVRRLPGAVLGHQGAEYLPVRPNLVVEVEAEPTISTFSNRTRPRVHRLRPELDPGDVEPSSQW